GYPGRGRLPAAGGQRGYLPCLEEEVRAPGRERAPPPAAARGRKRAVEAPGRRSHARQAHAVGGAAKKRLRPVRRRELAGWFHVTFQVSCARACRLAQFSRAAWYRRSRARDQSALRLRIRELAHARPRFGYLRISVMLRPAGWGVDRKRVRRLYRPDGLPVRMRVRRRKHIALHRGPAPCPTGPRERRSMDFLHDALADGRPFRILTVVESPQPVTGGGVENVRIHGGRSVGSGSRGRAPPALHHGGSRHRVSVAGARRLGVSPRRATRLYSPWQAHRKTRSSNRSMGGSGTSA